MGRMLALITGAGGEMGQALIPVLVRREIDVVALDLRPLPDDVGASCARRVEGSILDDALMDGLFAEHAFTHVFHLAAILSSQAERDFEAAHRVNVEGTFGVFRRCTALARATGAAPRLLFPSSIAVYGMPDGATKREQGAVRESQWLVPAGMYGCNKLYCELVGNYLSRRPADGTGPALDFRAIRFPGLISAETLPTGGTTDYAPEMIHAAARGEAYACFVSESSRLPFMTMPDAVDALFRLADAAPERLTRRVYNARGFSASAREIRAEVLRHFPDARITFEPAPRRQAIVDSWPEDIDDARARRDWGFAPDHDLRGAFGDYLVPALVRRYAGAGTGSPRSAADPQGFPQPHDPSKSR